MLYNHDAMMLQINLDAFSSGANKHALFVILDNFCKLLQRINIEINQENTSSDESDLEELPDLVTRIESNFLLKSGIRCDHCQVCNFCKKWLCSDCLQKSGFSNKNFYCNYFKSLF